MKTETSLTKPSLILSLDRARSLGVPQCMTTNIMHLSGNISDLLISLWHGKMDVSGNDDKSTWDWAVLRDEAHWVSHGQDVTASGRFIPGSYDCKPHNLAEKINTRYKTWEFQLYTFGLLPILLHGILPIKYWSHFCLLIRGFQIMCQHSLMHEQLQDAHALLCTWQRDFELIYYQLRHDWLHFVQPAVHQDIHLMPEAFQKGPPICYVQWTMECTIGNLGKSSNHQSHMRILPAKACGIVKSTLSSQSCPSSTPPPIPSPMAQLILVMATYFSENVQSTPFLLMASLPKHSMNTWPSPNCSLILQNGHGFFYLMDELLTWLDGRCWKSQETMCISRNVKVWHILLISI